MCLTRLFSLKELEELNEKQLAILSDAIRREILTSKDIEAMLRKKLQPMYDELKDKNKGKGKGRTKRG